MSTSDEFRVRISRRGDAPPAVPFGGASIAIYVVAAYEECFHYSTALLVDGTRLAGPPRALAGLKFLAMQATPISIGMWLRARLVRSVRERRGSVVVYL